MLEFLRVVSGRRITSVFADTNSKDFYAQALPRKW